MKLNIAKELAALGRMTVGQLRERYVEVHDGEPTRSFHKEFLIRKIMWRMQAVAEGDLTERARKRAAEIANDADLRLRAPPGLRLVGDGPVATKTLTVAPEQRLPLPGSMLTREYKGRTINVRVLPKGFEYEGEVYRSLSAIAQAVTGSHWNGWAFFGVKPARSGAKRGGT